MTGDGVVDLGTDDALTVRAATAEADAALAAWVELMDRVRFDEIGVPTQIAMSAIYVNLRNVPDVPERERMRGAFKYRWTRNTEIMRVAEPLLASLAARGTVHRVVRGAAVQAVRGLLGSRPIDAVDLVVPEEALAEVLQALGESGFVRSAASCSGRSLADHYAGLVFESGLCRVHVHVAEHADPALRESVRVPVHESSLADVRLPVPPVELLVLDAAMAGAVAPGPSERVQALIDVAGTLPLVDADRLAAAAEATGLLPDLLHVTAQARAIGVPLAGVDSSLSHPPRAVGRARGSTRDARPADAAGPLRRFRVRQRGGPALARVASSFSGDRRAYGAWVRGGQFAAAERLLTRRSGGFLPVPPEEWPWGVEAQPFAGGPVPGVVASEVAADVLDWRFRARLPGPAARATLTLRAPVLDSVDAVLYVDGRPIVHVARGNPASRVVRLTSLGVTPEFSLRPLAEACPACFGELRDLRVRLEREADHGDGA